MKIAVLVGSLRSDSINKNLAQNLEKLAAGKAEFIYPSLEVPLFSQDLEAELPASVIELKQAVESADGVLIVTPEYNRSFPGVLKNAIDWASRPYGANSFQGKPAGIVGASPGQTGATQAQAQLRNVLIYLDTQLMGQPELYISAPQAFDDGGGVREESKEFLQNYIDSFIEHIERGRL